MKNLFAFGMVVALGSGMASAHAEEFILRIGKQDRPALSSAVGSLGAMSEFEIFGRAYAKVAVPADKVAEFQKRVAALRDTEVEANIEYSVFSEETYLAKQWGIRNEGKNEPITLDKMSPVPGVVGADVGALEAWNLSRGRADLIVAVIDTGIDTAHPDLIANLWTNRAEASGQPGVDDDGNGFIDDVHGYDFMNSDADPMDDNKHGTHVAGIIGAAHDGQGTVGVMPEVSLMAVKFADAQGRGDLEKALKGIEYAVKNGARVLNNSWGSRRYSKFLEDAIREANARGVVFVAAAGNFVGNNNDTDPIYPANYAVENVISVGAFAAQDYPSAFSCYGPKTIHVAAPGTNILSTVPGGRYEVLSGTSMASPFVAGVAGLALALNPALTPGELRARILATAVKTPKLEKKNASDGRIHAGRLLRAMK